jgi:hypothetical protein
MKINTATSLIRDNAVLTAIAHAVSTLKFPDFSFTHSWDGSNYSVNNAQGARGTVSFLDGEELSMVGAFFDESCAKNPFSNGGEMFTSLLERELPTSLKDLASQEAFMYLLQEWNGGTVPIVTALCWGTGVDVSCCDSIDEFLSNGGRLIARELGLKGMIDLSLREDFGLSEKEMVFVNALYKRRIGSSLNTHIFLSPEDMGFLELESADSEGLSLSLESLSEIGIVPRS